jgi:hypothetical protein
MKSFQVTLDGIPYTAEFAENGIVITDEDGERPSPEVMERVHSLAVRMVLHMQRIGIAGIKFVAIEG